MHRGQITAAFTREQASAEVILKLLWEKPII